MLRTSPLPRYFLFSLLLAGMSYWGYLNWITGPMEQSLVMPVKETLLAVVQGVRNTTGVFQSYASISQLRQDHARLVQTAEELRHSVDSLREENEQLRAQVHAPATTGVSLLPARVTALSGTMELSVGSHDNVKVGMMVVSQETVVGVITAVSPYRSTVTLPTDPSLSIPVRTSRGIAGIAVGKLGNQILLDHVLQKDPLFLDDQVYTTGSQGYIPNLLIGTLNYITNSDVAVYKQATIKPPLDYGSLRVVFVVISG